jgi:hypothetical protein
MARGPRGLARLLYPSFFPEDIRVEARRLYAQFYQQGPRDKQLDQLFATATPPR